jgi:2-(1,2-epoxy-1,2-dihydrophenyl)acetyl-CoA isomerase
MEAAIICDEDTSIRCVVLTGAGRMFCVGGDLGVFVSSGENLPALLDELTAYLHSAISRFARMNKPLLTSINGAAAGAGFGLAILGDIVLAAHTAKFTLAYSGIGFSPDGGATWLLPRLVGLRRAQELVFTNKRLSADDAAAVGLITRSVDGDNLAAETALLAAQLSTSPIRALGRTRNLLLSSFGNSLEEQMELEARAIAVSGGDFEGREGLAAFLSKRAPIFVEK